MSVKAEQYSDTLSSISMLHWIDRLSQEIKSIIIVYPSMKRVNQKDENNFIKIF